MSVICCLATPSIPPVAKAWPVAGVEEGGEREDPHFWNEASDARHADVAAKLPRQVLLRHDDDRNSSGALLHQRCCRMDEAVDKLLHRQSDVRGWLACMRRVRIGVRHGPDHTVDIVHTHVSEAPGIHGLSNHTDPSADAGLPIHLPVVCRVPNSWPHQLRRSPWHHARRACNLGSRCAEAHGALTHKEQPALSTMDGPNKVLRHQAVTQQRGRPGAHSLTLMDLASGGLLLASANRWASRRAGIQQ
mmetsp:Transcript_38581/g.111470  ORF Transcript_38581/g.111470 Transcript_38581/m.111470 type:complete len:247 (-) Transcript_38581:3224-3964(-)